MPAQTARQGSGGEQLPGGESPDRNRDPDPDLSDSTAPSPTPPHCLLQRRLETLAEGQRVRKTLSPGRNCFQQSLKYAVRHSFHLH